MGLISLCGIVVRNAIILIDYTKERMREGHPLQKAATEAGERRLRPIFLTTMAAAAGVLPMILSGSSLWSPLASVIAIGLIWSMFMTLLVVPVLFVIVKSRRMKPSSGAVAAMLIAGLMLAANPASAETKRLTLTEAVDLAMERNSAVKISRFKVEEKEKKIDATTADYYPQLANDSRFAGISERQQISIPAGGLGTIPGIGPFPAETTTINQGSSTFFFSNTTLSQPLTQLFKIHDAAEIARSDQNVANAEARQTENDVILAVHQLYYALLAAGKQKEATDAGLSAALETLHEAENGVRSKTLLEVALNEARTAVLQNRQSIISTDVQIADLNSELNNVLGLPLDTVLVLSEPDSRGGAIEPSGYYLQAALSGNPEARSRQIQCGQGAKRSEGGPRRIYP